MIGCSATADFIYAKGLCDAVLSSREYAEAAAVIEPLVAAVRELESQVLAEQADHCQRLNALREAEEKATADSLAKIECDPAILKLRAEAMAHENKPVEPAPLVRGVIKSRPNLEAVPA